MNLILLKNIKKTHLFPIILIAFFPFLVFLGSGVINLQVILIDIIFLYELIKYKKLNYLHNKFFYLLLILWFFLIINLIFSIDVQNSLSRSLGFFRFIILVFALKYFILDENIKYKNFILSIWTIAFFIISIDLLFEFTFGYNILGFKSYMPGRLSGFFNQELKIGYLYSFLAIIVSSFIYLNFCKDNIISLKNYKIKKNYIYLFLLIILFIALIIGERANFIKMLFMLFCFIFLFEKKFYKIKFLIISIFFFIVLSTFLSLKQENQYKYRFWGMFLKPFISNPIEYLKNSNYGDHYYAAYKIFLNNKAFGVGLKNYRKEVNSGEYGYNTSTHPHEKHLEILSETGIIGYSSFLFIFIYLITKSIKNFIKIKNLYQLSGLLFVVANLIPLIPSGSIFTTYNATFFWISFSFMLFSNKKES